MQLQTSGLLSSLNSKLFVNAVLFTSVTQREELLLRTFQYPYFILPYFFSLQLLVTAFFAEKNPASNKIYMFPPTVFLSLI